MFRPRRLAPALALLLLACSNGTQGVDSLNTGADRLSGDKSEGAVLRIADATRANGDPVNAINLYRRAHELAKDDPVPLARLGATLADQHAYNEAVEAYHQALKLAPNDPDIQRGMAGSLLAVNQPQLALTHLNAALDHRKDPRTYSLIGVANDLLGRYDVAQRSYADGLLLAPDNLALRNNLGLSQALSGNFAQATATLTEAASSVNATPRTRQNLALAYGLAGDTEKAAAVARRDLDEQTVKNNLAYYAMLRGLDDRARAAAIIGAHAPTRGTDGEAAALSDAKQVSQGDKPRGTTEQSASIAPPPNRTVETVALAMPEIAPPAPAPVKAAETPMAPPHPLKSVRAKPATPAPAPRAVEPSSPAPAPNEQAALPATAAQEEAPAPQRVAAVEPPATVIVAEPTPPAPTQTAPASAAASPQQAPSETVATTAPAQTSPASLAAPAQQAPAPTVATSAPEQLVAASAPPAAQSEPAPSAIAAAEPMPNSPEIAPVGTKSASKTHRFLVQVGAFHDPERAKKLCNELAAKGYDLAVTTGHSASAQDWYFCRSTAMPRTEAAALAQRLRDEANTAPTLVPAPAALASAD